jgi:alcohol dehydrogenase class IV
MGFDRAGIDGLAQAALTSFKSNATAPREVDLDSLTAIYEQSLKAY